MSFKKGQSGNPAGRPKDTRTAELRSMLREHSEELVNKVVDLAKDGDLAALRLCLERILPPLKAREDAVSIPGFDANGSLVERSSHVVAALAAGQISPTDAAAVMSALAAEARIVETDEIERRLAALEAQR